MIGNVVNLATRLMQAASASVLCDDDTFQLTQSLIEFDSLPSIHVKGKSGEVSVHRPTGRLNDRECLEISKTLVVGRSKERAILLKALRNLQINIDGIVLIEGEAGIGKSKLVEDLIQNAQKSGASLLIGGGDTLEKSTPLFAWRPIFGELFGLDSLPEDISIRRRCVVDRLRSNEKLSRLAPLINVVLSLDIQDTNLTKQMTGEVRAANTDELLLELLRIAAGENGLLIIIEDAHWLDSASWDLALKVSREVSPALLVVTTRPLYDPVPEEYCFLAAEERTKTISLKVLPRDETLSLVCQSLGVESLPTAIGDLIQKKSEGLPLFSEELAYAMRDAGVITIKSGQCELASGAGSPRSFDFPDTVQGVIVSRIDRLVPSQQLLLKVASAIGRTFPFDILRELHPIPRDIPAMPSNLEELERLDFITTEDLEPELSYLFKHVIIREAAYRADA